MVKESKYADDEVLLRRIAREFFVEKVATTTITAGLKRENPDFPASNFYYLLSLLMDKGIISYQIPLEDKLTQELRESFPFNANEVIVVRDSEDVPEYAARIAADILLERWRTTQSGIREDLQKPIGLGLGPGGMTAHMTLELGKILQNKSSGMQLKLVAMTGGSLAHRPELSPISFFGELPCKYVREKIGLFAPNLVEADQMEAMRATPGVMEAYAARDDLFLCVTAMGDVLDKKDLLTQFLQAQPQEGALSRLEEKGMRGNIQYRPYSDDGPITEDEKDFRAVTVLELEDMHRYSQMRDNEILLMVRNKSGESLMPLIKSREFRPFTKLVIDAVSADRVLRYKKEFLAEQGIVFDERREK